MDPPGWFPLIVRGGRGANATYDGGTLTVRFGKASVAAGDPTTYPGTGEAWQPLKLYYNHAFHRDRFVALHEEMPVNQTDVHHAVPVYEHLPGWWEDISGARSLSDLPANAQKYVQSLEELSGARISAVGVGPARRYTDRDLTARDAGHGASPDLVHTLGPDPLARPPSSVCAG